LLIAECSGIIKADIVFALDESGSVSEDEFNQALLWTIEVLNSFQ